MYDDNDDKKNGGVGLDTLFFGIVGYVVFYIPWLLVIVAAILLFGRFKQNAWALAVLVSIFIGLPHFYLTAIS